MKIIHPIGNTIIKRCIYQSSSGIRVYQNPRFRWLTFGNQFIQTVIRRRHPQRPALDYISLIIQVVLNSPGDCCLLGLGGAGIAHALRPGLGTASIIAVDNNQEVIDIANRYFNLSDINHLITIHQNADRFVATAAGHYQHMLIDLHDANAFPHECNHPQFFAHCHALIKPGGTLIVNVLNIQKNRSLFEYIQRQFNNDVILVPIKATTNTLIVAYHLTHRNQLLNRVKTHGFIKHLIWDDYWGYIGHTD